jgi:hypothetical protein
MRPSLQQTAEHTMTTTRTTPTPTDLLEPVEAQDDAFLSQVDDEALAQALKTVHWHPKDVGQFLRAVARR